jgi:hypothetical protein
VFDWLVLVPVGVTVATPGLPLPAAVPVGSTAFDSVACGGSKHMWKTPVIQTNLYDCQTYSDIYSCRRRNSCGPRRRTFGLPIYVIAHRTAKIILRVDDTRGIV